MTDADLIEIIADGIVDGTDMDCTPADQARAVLKALRDAGVLPQWHPIETAPKKHNHEGASCGPLVLLASTYGHLAVGYWGRGIANASEGWCNPHDHLPMQYWNAFTHWQPLPEAPQ
jgi:hypothetical protein